ncbi:pentapeptide repeat-containing protein [Pleurocapsales cyanobacterium LEGE 10410]|nr:pentapeptide repeat-containing protein [Pleurocapsales cyanobacterium LEGE 10410]
MFLILSLKRFKTLTGGIIVAFTLSSCSGRVNAVCDGTENFDIYYNPNHYQQLIETKNCIDCELNGINADLSNLDLTGADLGGAELAGANLSGTKLTNANLEEADLQRANLSGANLQGAIIFRADLRKANLLGAKLPDYDLAFPPKLDGATMPDGTIYGKND